MSIHGMIKWEETINSKFNSWMQNETWRLMDLLLGCTTSGCKWIFKIKLKSDGSINKYKTWLVVKEYSQVHGVDYHDTFSHVVKITYINVDGFGYW
jgi:hypothetical protein